jgi:2-amino-4-hydroxy-6-hydroxymethyldihydropteridine diphosphokinase
MPQAFIALGSNMDPERNLELALQRLAQRERLLAISTVWRTPPLDRPEQSDYLNCVALIETSLPPLDLKFGVLREIEAELGRVRSEDKCASRTIDLDLIGYDDLQVESEELVLPDPDIRQRPFLAAGLLELAPELRLSGWHVSIAQVAAVLPRGQMAPLGTFTRNLREKIFHESRSD